MHLPATADLTVYFVPVLISACSRSQLMRHFQLSFTRPSKLINVLLNQNCRGQILQLLIMLERSVLGIYCYIFVSSAANWGVFK